jgi:hypothetical protein
MIKYIQNSRDSSYAKAKIPNPADVNNTHCENGLRLSPDIIVSYAVRYNETSIDLIFG